MRRAKGLSFTTANSITCHLTEKEKKFCEIYSRFGVSGIEAVIQAGYKVSTKNTAYNIASENLRKPKIMAYINTLYKEYKFTDEDVMREHLYLIKQHHDMSSKARGIDMYYKKKGLYSPEKQENQVVVVTSYANMPADMLQENIDRLKSKAKRGNTMAL